MRQGILIGKDIIVSVNKIEDQGRVELAIMAPKDMSVVRLETLSEEH